MTFHELLAQRVLIVAEIGNNHEGNVDVALRMVDEAAASGADAVKFQTFRTSRFQSPRDEARYRRLASFELSQDAFRRLHDRARERGLIFLSTPLDLESAAFLEPLVDAYKIASGDTTFYPLLSAVAATGKPVVLSSGLSDLRLIAEVKGYVELAWASRGIAGELAILHCVTSYPAPAEQANLAAIPLMAQTLGCPIGYSDHTLGITACIAAAALGARVIEKHFTLDKAFSDFRDHQLSADPSEMRELVTAVREVSVLVGSAAKVVQPSEAALELVVRRSIAAGADLAAGQTITWNDLVWVRPAGGLPPGEEHQVVGRVTRRQLAAGDPILPADLL